MVSISVCSFRFHVDLPIVPFEWELILLNRTGEGREDIIDEQEMGNYLMAVMAVQKLMQSELSLLSGIIPSQHQHQVFQIIIQEALNTIVQDGEVSQEQLISL